MKDIFIQAYNIYLSQNGIYDALSIEAIGYKAIALAGTGQNKIAKLLDETHARPTFIVMTDNDATAGKLASERIEAELQKRNILYIPYTQYIDYLQYYEAMRNMKDSNEMLIKRRGDFISLIKKLYAEAEAITLADYNKDTASTYFTDFLERVTSNTYEPIPTQFTRLNKALGGRLLETKYNLHRRTELAQVRQLFAYSLYMIF